MYKWKLEEMKIMNDQLDTGSWTEDEKISFIDEHEDGKMSYILELINKYIVDLPSLKKDSSSKVLTLSLKAWLKRNDSRKMVDDWYHYGEISFLKRKGGFYTSNPTYLTNPEILNIAHLSIDDVLNRTINKLKKKEESYFRSIDPYEIALAEWNKHKESFGNHIFYGSSVGIYDDEGNRRILTLDELNLLNDGARRLQELKAQLSAEINISF